MLRLTRKRNGMNGPTEGTIEFDSNRLFTLEDPWKDNQRNISCIPAGTYAVTYAWSNRFTRLMPRILDVPGRDGILIHPGNTAKDTHGCILVGTVSVNGAIYDSQRAFLQLDIWLSRTLRSTLVTIEIGYENPEKEN